MSFKRGHFDIPDQSRRSMIKWTIGVGAALGLRPWKIFEVNESIFGSAFAQTAACMPVNRFVCNVMGDGSFAWMTQLFPFTAQATQGGESAFYATGQATDQLVEPGDHPMKLSPDAPRLGGKRVTGFLCGNNEAHTRKPNTATRIESNIAMLAAVSAVQTASPSLVPSIAIGEMPYGSAAGAPMIATVRDSQGFVDLFSSAASAAGGTLATRENAALFEAAYKANLALHRAAGRPTALRGLRVAKTAAVLLGKNFAEELRPTADDLDRYGVGALDERMADIARTLIITVKAFKLNLTSSVLVPGMNDDPHGAFDNVPASRVRVMQLSRIWDAFMNDLLAEPDPLCSGSTIGDNTVLAWIGDTGKHPNLKAAWRDTTPKLANWMYVMGGGRLRSGWFGEVLAGENAIDTWNPTTGDNIAGGSTADLAALAAPASAAVLYAVAKGDMQRVQRYYRGPSIAGVIK